MAGRGGMGKSTCCRRVPPQWRALCDDEVLVVPNQQGRYMAHPFPTWSDYIVRRQENTWNVQQYVPLRAIFFLERSEHSEAIPLGQGQSAIYIYHSSSQAINANFRMMGKNEFLIFKKNLFDNSSQLAKALPAFKLPINLTGHFWEEIEKAIENA